MRYAVLQAFKTPLRRFHPGMEIDDSEIDGVLTADHWLSLGFLGAGPVDEVAAAAEKEVLIQEAEAIGLTIDPDIWSAEAMQAAIDAEVAAQAEAGAAAAAAAALAATTYTVLEGFVTPDHRFLDGMEISGVDVNGAIPVDDWVERGFLVVVAEPDLALPLIE